jgi:oligopeptide transport system permease protein
LLGFTLLGPIVWSIDPADQDLDQISQPPGVDRAATLVDEFEVWDGSGRTPGSGLHLVGEATTQRVRLAWDVLPGANGHRVYRNLFPVGPELAFGIPIAEFTSNETVFFEDRLDVRAGRYYYSLVALDDFGRVTDEFETITVDVARVITIREALARDLVDEADARLGETVLLTAHPLGTDYLGRDMLARLMAGARVSLFIGIGGPLLFVIFGVVFGSVAGFMGGRVDSFMMRFADFVVALPFLLFMILFKIAFGIGPGESGVFPMLIALVVLMWPATARLVRGQVIQIREQGYIEASQLLGASTPYLIFRHMFPNTLGVVLVTLTFEIPRAIFIEAFLSFIGMGVAPPTPSWGSMSNEGIKTMLTTPHELIFPALLISITVLAFNLLGDGLRDSLDARMRNQQ